MYKYINKNNEIRTVIKAKGMPKKYLTQEYFLKNVEKQLLKNHSKKFLINQQRKNKRKNKYVFYL